MNARRVRLHAAFRRDFRAQLAWLVAQGRESWIEKLADAVEEVTERLGRFPEIGPVQAKSRLLVVRKIIFRRLPYIAWYGYRARAPIRTVWLLRMFGARQDRSFPDPEGWSLR